MISDDNPAGTEIPDLWTQFEDILEAVRIAEADWDFNDRLDLALGVQPPGRKVR